MACHSPCLPCSQAPTLLCVKLSSFHAISSTGVCKGLATEQNLCAVSSGSVNPYEPGGMLFCSSKLPSPRRWEGGSDPTAQAAGALCWARGNHPELKGNAHQEKAQSPHRSSKEKDYTSFMLPSRQIISTLQRISHKDKMGTNPMPLASQRWQKELQPHLWRALVDDVLSSMGKAAEANSNQGGSCSIAQCAMETGILGASITSHKAAAFVGTERNQAKTNSLLLPETSPKADTPSVREAAHQDQP